MVAANLYVAISIALIALSYRRPAFILWIMAMPITASAYLVFFAHTSKVAEITGDALRFSLFIALPIAIASAVLGIAVEKRSAERHIKTRKATTPKQGDGKASIIGEKNHG